MRKHALPILAAFVLTACGTSGTGTPTPAPSVFDVAAVRANFTDECLDPAVVDALFCEQVQIAGMTAVGDTLYVPTTLDAGPSERAEKICDQVASAHFDSSGTPLGYEVIGILDKDGGNAAACSIR